MTCTTVCPGMIPSHHQSKVKLVGQLETFFLPDIDKGFPFPLQNI